MSCQQPGQPPVRAVQQSWEPLEQRPQRNEGGYQAQRDAAAWAEGSQGLVGAVAPVNRPAQRRRRPPQVAELVEKYDSRELEV